MKRTSQSDYALPFRWIAPVNKPHKGYVTAMIPDNANSQSVEFVYGIESDFLFDGGHLGICNTIVFPLYIMMVDYQYRLKEVTQRLGYYTENRLWTKETSHADYLVYSFVFLFLNPRDYTVLNRRKESISLSVPSLTEELSCVDVLQGYYERRMSF